MQFVIEAGPIVNRQSVGMSLSNKHHRRLTNILLDWYWSLPGGVRYRIESIRAAPCAQHHPSIRVDVVLTGEYPRQGGETEAGGMREWRSSFCYSFPYRAQYTADNQYKPDCFEPELTKRLTSRLHEDLHKELEAARALTNSLSATLGP